MFLLILVKDLIPVLPIILRGNEDVRIITEESVVVETESNDVTLFIRSKSGEIS